MKTWIVDIDGTLADNEHRLHYITNGHKDWKKWHAESHTDTPINEIVEIIKLGYISGVQIVLCTGRDEFCREATVEWLTKHEIPYDALYMRYANDRRDDDKVKYDLLADIRQAGYNPVLVFEDRKRVVDMWRDQGLRCLHVAPGEF